tara:strand:- start:6975 stop:8087 length:1113 start_codon:yes stop_codon:yes gene_type:complete
MKTVSDITYPGLEVSKNLVTDASKSVETEDFVAGGARIYGVYTEGGTNSIPLTWADGSNSTLWQDIFLPDDVSGPQIVETPSVDPGEYAVLGAIGVYVTDVTLAPSEFQVRVTNGTDSSQWIPVTLGLPDEIEQIPIQMPVVATVSGAWRLQGRTLNDLTSGQAATFYIEVSTSLILVSADTTSFTQNIPSRIPSSDYTEVTEGSGKPTWAASLADVDHFYSITFTTPDSVPTGQHIFGVGAMEECQLLRLNETFALEFYSGFRGSYAITSAALSPSTQYSAIMFVDTTNDLLYMWVKATDDPQKITVLDAPISPVAYPDNIHADPTEDAFVATRTTEQNFIVVGFGTVDFTGTIDRKLRYYLSQRPQGV